MIGYLAREAQWAMRSCRGQRGDWCVLICNDRHTRKGNSASRDKLRLCVYDFGLRFWFLEAPEVMIAFFIALDFLFRSFRETFDRSFFLVRIE